MEHIIFANEMKSYDLYEPVIGLEVHAQLLTKSKAYSSDKAEYGGEPNTYVSAITLGHPGTLPVLNKKTIELAIKMGIATHCTINTYNQFARKNYFYADLPKGYQITQDKTPICTGGYVIIGEEGKEKKIGVTRIHMEEDAGKSIHDLDPFYTLIDLNRAGTPLIEIVSDPDLCSGDEAYQYLTEVRKLVQYLDICDGNMEEGSLRCDANISVRKKGDPFGVKVEVKNMNSIRNVKRAIEFEIKRQVEAIENGETIYQETRNFDPNSGTTKSMRSKESAHDYRYFPEPDLPPVIITAEVVQAIRETMPALPAALKEKYIHKLQLSSYDAEILTSEKSFSDYFEQIILHTSNYKSAANWLIGPIKEWCNASANDVQDFPLTAKQISEIIQWIDVGKINFTIASQQLFPAMLNEPKSTLESLAIRLHLIQEQNTDLLDQFILKALEKYPDKVIEYKSGRKNLIGLFMGEVMKLSGGKADPKLTNQLLQEKLNQ